jgi:hypothetical protein
VSAPGEFFFAAHTPASAGEESDALSDALPDFPPELSSSSSESDSECSDHDDFDAVYYDYGLGASVEYESRNFDVFDEFDVYDVYDEFNEFDHGPDAYGEKDALFVSSGRDSLLAATAPGSWILDSGATRHVCGDPGAFDGLLELPTPITIGTVGGPVVARRQGTVSLEVLSGRLHLVDTLLVPASFNLVSVRKLDEAGASVTFGNGAARVTMGGKPLFTARLQGRLYLLDQQVERALAASIDNAGLWHRRLGHLRLIHRTRVARFALPLGIGGSRPLARTREQ